MPLQNLNEEKERLSWLHLVQISNLPYSALFLIWLGLAGVFGVFYFVLATYLPEHGPANIEAQTHVLQFLNCMYYSIITATSTGYGDITPQGFSKFLAALQSISALFVFAVFVTKLVSQRQEIALQEVHRLTYQDIVHNTRGDLFIIRKDLDMIGRHAIRHNDLTSEHWETLMVAYKQAQNAISGIPEFYDGGNALYQIDNRREELLLEAVHRTLHRINQTLDTLSTHNIAWMEHEPSFTELQELVKLLDATAPLWEERSPYGKREAFEDIVSMKTAVHDKCQSTL